MVNKTEYWEKIYECDQCYIFSHKDEIHKIKIKKWQRYVTIEIFKNTLLSLLIKNHHIFQSSVSTGILYPPKLRT